MEQTQHKTEGVLGAAGAGDISQKQGAGACLWQTGKNSLLNRRGNDLMLIVSEFASVIYDKTKAKK
ncbi:MAG: hypothetical protein V4621_02130 [Pseudomonadota bacterium]